MFAVMENTEGHWRRSIINKIRNTTWQILDENGLSVVGTVDDSNNDGPSKGWGKTYRHPTKRDYKKAIADAKSSHPPGEDDDGFQSPRRKKLREDAYLGQLNQGRKMRGKSLSASEAELAVGTVVQFALHPVDVPNKVDGRNMTCVVVTKVNGTGYLEAPKYRLACNAGTFDRLYHRSYLEVIKNASPESMGLGDALARWMYLPVIKEREGQRSTSIVSKHGKVVESEGRSSCNCKGDCATNRCSCFKHGLQCNSKCHGGVNHNCTNHETE